MMLPWWGWIAFVGMVLAGIGAIVAPAIGAWWARDFRPTHCVRCGRELVGSPPMHLLGDRMHCRSIALARIAKGERP